MPLQNNIDNKVFNINKYIIQNLLLNKYDIEINNKGTAT